MTQNVLTGIALLFAIYGLSCLIRSIVSLLLRPVQKPYIILPVKSLTELPAGIFPAIVYSADGIKFKKIFVIDAGIPENEKEKFQSLCRREGVELCEISALPELILTDLES